MNRLALVLTFMAAGFAAPDAASAQACTGNCGTAVPNGVVTAPPEFGPSYSYVSTVGGVNGAGQIAGVEGTNGSEYLTGVFSALAGDALQFYFNYVTSDGSSSYTDYAFAELLMGGAHEAWLFTARTTPSGDTSPGFGLPANDSVLSPVSTPIVPGGPSWDALGSDSGECFAAGCGFTGWIQSSFTLASDGLYQLRFGVSNVGDTGYDSGLAFAGVTVNGSPVTGAIPEPATWALLMLGLGLVGGALRGARRRQVCQVPSF